MKDYGCKEEPSKIDSFPSKQKENFEMTSLSNSEKRFYEIKIGRFSRQISRPLILLKISLFTLFGAGFMQSFITVLYKQRGITASELSTMYIFAPIAQILMTILAGVLIDKFGKPKHTFAVDIGILIAILLSMLFIPPTNPECERDPQVLNCTNSTFLQFNDSSHPIDAQKRNLTCSKHDFLTPQSLNCLNPDPGHLVAEHNGQKAHSEHSRNHIPCDIHDFTHDGQRIALENHNRRRRLSDDLLTSSSNVSSSNLLILCNYNDTHFSFNMGFLDECFDVCSGTCKTALCKYSSNSREFLVAIYGFLFVMFLTAYTVSYRIMDIMVMSMISQHGGDYGHQRFFSISGDLTVSAFTGYIVDLTTDDKDMRNYATALYMGMALSILQIILVYRLDVTITKSKERMSRETLKLLKNLDVVVFMLVLLVLGTSWNFSTSYTVWYLENFNVPSVLLGLQATASSLYGLPVLLTARYIISKLGTVNILILTYFAYIVNFMCFSYLQDAWWSLAIVSTQTITYFLLWVTVMEYSNQLAPEGMKSSVIALAGGLHYSFSKLSMAVTGGQVLSAYGERVAFRFMAAVCLVGGVLSAIYYGCRHIQMKNVFKKQCKGEEANVSGQNVK